MDMKKVIALVLALVLALMSVSALAAGSPENPGGKANPGTNTTTDTTTGDTTEAETEVKIDEDGSIEVEKATDTTATNAIKTSLKDDGLDLEKLIEQAAEAQAEADKKAEEAENTEGKTEEQQSEDAEAAEKAEQDAAEATKLVAQATKTYVESLSQEVQEQILDDEGGLEIDDIVVNEIETVKLPKIEDIPEENKKDGKLTIKKTFQTPYKNKEKVKVLVLIPAKNGEVKQLVLNGVANEDGDIVIEVTEEEYRMMMDQEVVMMPISKAGLK
jgi:hypothetical protein